MLIGAFILAAVAVGALALNNDDESGPADADPISNQVEPVEGDQ